MESLISMEIYFWTAMNVLRSKNNSINCALIEHIIKPYSKNIEDLKDLKNQNMISNQKLVLHQ